METLSKKFYRLECQALQFENAMAPTAAVPIFNFDQPAASQKYLSCLAPADTLACALPHMEATHATANANDARLRHDVRP